MQGRVSYVRMVTPRALPKNEDLAIVTIPPEVHGELNYAELRDRRLDLLVDHYELRVRDIQRCPLGRNQSFRLSRVSDRDSLVNLSPHQHQGLSYRFVNHNRGSNARRVNFNRECWLMLIGYPEDYRSTHEIADTIKSFGRIILWQKDNVLGRVILKARVTELTDVPHYIVISKGDDFEGTSLTGQCEILQQNLMGGGPPDEDIPPGGLDDGFIFPALGLGIGNLQHLPGHQGLWAHGHHQQLLQQGVGNQHLDLNLAQSDLDPHEHPAEEEDNVNQQDHQGDAEMENLQEEEQVDEGNEQGEEQISLSINLGLSINSSSNITEQQQIPDLNLVAPGTDEVHMQEEHFEEYFPEILLALPAQPVNPLVEDAQLENPMEIQENAKDPEQVFQNQQMLIPEAELDGMAMETLNMRFKCSRYPSLNLSKLIWYQFSM